MRLLRTDFKTIKQRNNNSPRKSLFSCWTILFRPRGGTKFSVCRLLLFKRKQPNIIIIGGYWGGLLPTTSFWDSDMTWMTLEKPKASSSSDISDCSWSHQTSRFWSIIKQRRSTSIKKRHATKNLYYTCLEQNVTVRLSEIMTWKNCYSWI